MRSWTPVIAAAMLLGAPAAIAQTSTSPAQVTPTKPGTSVSDATIQQAGKAMRDVVSIRRRYAQQMQSAGNSADKQQLAMRAQNESAKAVTAQGLSVSQYNNVIEQARSDPSVKERLLNAAGEAQQ